MKLHVERPGGERKPSVSWDSLEFSTVQVGGAGSRAQLEPDGSGAIEGFSSRMVR